jgi:hypothetical protein
VVLVHSIGLPPLFHRAGLSDDRASCGAAFNGPLPGATHARKQRLARCDFVWRQPRLKCHLPGRLPDNADDSASVRSYVVQLVPESRWLIADRMDTVLLASHSDRSSGSRM